MSRIITPGYRMRGLLLVPIPRAKWQERRRSWWEYRYATDAKVYAEADRIHRSKMLPPPTCDQCIKMAI